LEVKKTEKKRNELQPYGVSEKRPLGVATDLEMVIKNLKREEFKIVQTLEEATILFLNENIKENLTSVSKTHFVNQFPYESCIVMKHNLASTVFQGLGHVKWIQQTFDLGTQLKEFIGNFEFKNN
jgi:tubulin--tyrosine ligase-like protein 12